MKIILPHEFKAREYQKASSRAFFIDRYRFIIDLWHRRAGKTLDAVNMLVGAGFERVGTYLHLFPQLNQVRFAVWQGKDNDGRPYVSYFPKQLVKHVNNMHMEITLINGSIIKFAGSDRYDKLMGSNPVGIIFDEYSLQNPFAWHYLSPILTANGGWARFIYTPRGANHGQKLYLRNIDNPDWFVQKLDVTQTKNCDGSPIVTPEQIEMRRRDGTPEELIQQEYYLSFDVALAGSYYSKEIEEAYKDNRVRDFELDRSKPVHTAWDLARTRDANSIWIFQVINGQIHLYDYIEGHMNTMQTYIKNLGEFARKHKVRFNMHFAPHDIRVTDYTSEKSRLEVAASMGFHFSVAKMLPIMDGIDATKTLFPRFVFHKTNCELGLDCLKQYQRDDNGKPKHDFASHPSDALRCLAVGWYEYYGSEQQHIPHTINKWKP